MSKVFAYFVFTLLMAQPFALQAKSEVFAEYELQLSQDEVALLLDGDISFNFSSHNTFLSHRPNYMLNCKPALLNLLDISYMLSHLNHVL